MIQDELYGQTIDVTVPVAVMGDELSKKDAKDIAVNFVDEALTRHLVGAASTLGADVHVGAVRAEPLAQRPKSDALVEAPLGDPHNEEASLAMWEKIVGVGLTAFLFLLVFILELTGAW